MLKVNKVLRMVALLALVKPQIAGLVGGLGGPISLLELEQRADLIVTGATTSPFPSAATVSFSITVNRVVKGDPALVGTSVRVSWSGPNGSQPSHTVTDRGLWFLQSSTNGWKILPVFSGGMFDLSFFQVPAGPILTAYAYGPAASLSDKIASEVSSAIEGAAGAWNLQLYALQDGLLDQLQSPVIALLYERLSNSASPQQRILGLAGLIRAGNSAAITSAAKTASTLTNNPREGGLLLRSISQYYCSTDISSVNALGMAATDSGDPNLEFRKAAAHALAAIHNKTAVPYLAALLGDPNAQLQIEGVRGLGSFANGLPVQTPVGVPTLAHLQLPAAAPFRTPETLKNFALGPDAIAANKGSYVQFWAQWWSENRSALGY